MSKKSEQLGMNPGTASSRLKKELLWQYIIKAGDNKCFRCGKDIMEIGELSIEHKLPWLDSEDPIGRFFDLYNIAFSHLKCNVGAARHPNKGQKAPHGTNTRYATHGCRCDSCREAGNKRKQAWRNWDTQRL